MTEKRTYQNQAYQDKLDAATIYSLLENEIIPLYYARDKKTGISKGWIKVLKNSIAQIAPHYTMKRQLDDYYSKFYEKQAKRFKELSKNNNQLAKDIAQWKEAVAERWSEVHYQVRHQRARLGRCCRLGEGKCLLRQGRQREGIQRRASEDG